MIDSLVVWGKAGTFYFLINLCFRHKLIFHRNFWVHVRKTFVLLIRMLFYSIRGFGSATSDRAWKHSQWRSCSTDQSATEVYLQTPFVLSCFLRSSIPKYATTPLISDVVWTHVQKEMLESCYFCFFLFRRTLLDGIAISHARNNKPCYTLFHPTMDGSPKPQAANSNHVPH